MEHGEIDNVDDSLICLVQSLAKPAFPATHFFAFQPTDSPVRTIPNLVKRPTVALGSFQ
jgi:hypothetical protein